MRLYLRSSFIFCLVLAAAISAQSQTNNPDQIPTVSFCDLAEDATKYDQKIVRIKAIYMAGFEVSILFDPACKEKRAWTEFDFACKDLKDRKVCEQFETLTDTGFRTTPYGGILYVDGQVEVTFVGRFTGVKPSQQIGNRTFSFGFGHLNAFDYQFNVQQIESVKPYSAKR
jgi:hypothetical protein